MNEEGLVKIQENTLDWVSEWLNYDGGVRRLMNKLAQHLKPEDLDELYNNVISEMWCEMEFRIQDAIVEWCEERYSDIMEESQ